MSMLKEVLANIKRIDSPVNPNDPHSTEGGGDPNPNPFSLDDEDEVHPEVDGDSNVDPETDGELDDVVDQATSDPNRQGLIRTVKDAHLVYKRESEDGTFEELWLYNSTALQDEMQIKKAILAGTDIPTNKTQSPDGTQTYEIWAVGNGAMMLIKGIPS